ncbi:MAG TPA: winged helix DNA-binding domain-containing protein, partial [Actinomycetota bacterium]|nr:winged helix DNA-binding domain-containing protein [Actinomycetota bacterium]
MPDLSWDQVRAWRVARHGLDERSTRRRLLSVASEICGVHAQVGSAAELSLWARVEGVTPRDVRDALWKTKRLVRSWMMRGTIHLLPARDFPLYVAALATHDRWWKGAWLRAVGMSADELGALLGAIREALSDEPITREQLASRVGHLVGDHAREHLLSGWGSLLKPAAFNGSLCSGPPRGQNVTFVRPDLWLGRWEEHDGDQAVREVFRRYLRAYGQSHHEEFAAWWGGAPAFARRARLAIEEELREIDVDDMKRWVLRRDLAAMQRTAPLRGSVRLLPHFDAYVRGFRP